MDDGGAGADTEEILKKCPWMKHCKSDWKGTKGQVERD